MPFVVYSAGSFILHAIVSLLHDQARFTEHFSEPIKRSRAMNATTDDLKLGNKRIKELDTILQGNLIRRSKARKTRVLREGGARGAGVRRLRAMDC